MMSAMVEIQKDGKGHPKSSWGRLRAAGNAPEFMTKDGEGDWAVPNYLQRCPHSKRETAAQAGHATYSHFF